MKIYEILFSPTGGTKKVSDILSNAFKKGYEENFDTSELTIEIVDLMKADDDFSSIVISPDDLCVIAVPAYGGRVPAPAVSHLTAMNGNGSKAILAAVFGNRVIDETLLELQDVTISANFNPIAAIEAVAEHSLARVYGAGRPDAEDTKELENFAKHILDSLKNPSIAPLMVPGIRPFKEFKGSAAKPSVSKVCTSCGICAAQCPVQAIPKDAPDITDKNMCISCMRCVTVCPNHARYVPDEITQTIIKNLAPLCAGRKENRLYVGDSLLS